MPITKDVHQQVKELLTTKKLKNLGQCFWCFGKAEYRYKGNIYCEAHYQAEMIYANL